MSDSKDSKDSKDFEIGNRSMRDRQQIHTAPVTDFPPVLIPPDVAEQIAKALPRRPCREILGCALLDETATAESDDVLTIALCSAKAILYPKTGEIEPTETEVNCAYCGAIVTEGEIKATEGKPACDACAKAGEPGGETLGEHPESVRAGAVTGTGLAGAYDDASAVAA